MAIEKYCKLAGWEYVFVDHPNEVQAAEQQYPEHRGRIVVRPRKHSTLPPGRVFTLDLSSSTDEEEETASESVGRPKKKTSEKRKHDASSSESSSDDGKKASSSHTPGINK